jgi:GT2 family glycosyltransferase/glycosyltransferase involved in cell wall biosynthesis
LRPDLTTSHQGQAFARSAREADPRSIGSQPRVAAIVCCHNRVSKTIACLRSLLVSAGHSGVGAVVYLVDDGSTDGTSDAVRSEFGESVRIIAGDGQLYWTGGTSLAARHALAAGEELLLLLNDDTMLGRTALEVLLSDSRRARSVETALDGVVVGALTDQEGGCIAYGGVVRSSKLCPLRFRRAGVCGTPFRCATMNGNVVLIPAETWRLIGGLDEGLRHRAADFDLGLRLNRAGIPVVQSSQVVGTCPRNRYRAGHEPGLSLTQRFSRSFGIKGSSPRTVWRYTFRHGGALAPVWAMQELVAVALGAVRAHSFPQAKARAPTPPLPVSKVIYCVDFEPSLSAGKNRATQHKVDAMRRIGVEVDLHFPRPMRSLPRIVRSVLSEVRAMRSVWSSPSETTALVGRGFSGILAQGIARARGVATVREIHGLPVEEVRLLGRSWRWRLAHWPLFRLTSMLDARADVRIYNNGLLLRSVESGNLVGMAVVVPNGSPSSAHANCDMSAARMQLGISQDRLVLAFVGSASPWHGVDSLGTLQSEFDKQGLPVCIVSGGGPVGGLGPNGRSISPLDEHGCNLLIRAANACLLPSGRERTSPGSPLKLYDYLANGRAVIAQEGLEGYGDQVVPFGVGLDVDFRDPHSAARRIYDFVSALDLAATEERCLRLAKNEYSWESRVRQWCLAIVASRT